jgi:hypothetical protein
MYIYTYIYIYTYDDIQLRRITTKQWVSPSICVYVKHIKNARLQDIKIADIMLFQHESRSNLENIKHLPLKSMNKGSTPPAVSLLLM